MALRRTLASLGDASPAIDTVLTDPGVRPGGMLHGEVQIEGGSVDHEAEFITIGLVGAVVGEDDDGEYEEEVEIATVDLSDGFLLEANTAYSLPFSLQVPWDTPITHMFGERLDGMALGLRTQLAIAGERDAGDLDEIEVHPLHAHEVVFDAMQELGFRFSGAELEIGEIDIEGVHQTLPCFQEIEFRTPARYPDIEELDLTFVTEEHSTEVLIALEKRGGLLRASSEELTICTVDHSTVDEVDWAAEIHDWVRQACGTRGIIL